MIVTRFGDSKNLISPICQEKNLSDFKNGQGFSCLDLGHESANSADVFNIIYIFPLESNKRRKSVLVKID